MKKFKTLLILSGLAISLLAGCNIQSNPSGGESASDNPASSSSSEIQKAMTGIRVASEPTKKAYYVGDQEADWTGLAVQAVYNIGDPEDVALTDCTVSGFDASSAGEKAITVTYQEFTASFNINVYAVSGIEANTTAAKTSYYQDEQADFSGVVVSQVYSDGHKVAVDATAVEFSGFDSSSAGEKAITVTFGSLTTSFNVNIIGKTGISADATAGKTTYYQGEQQSDFSGVVVSQVYADGHKVAVSNSDCQFEGFDTSTGGEKAITVTYNNQQTSFNINVINEATLVIKSKPTKVNYCVDDELNLSGLVVAVVYADGHEETLSSDAYEVSGFDSSAEGDVEVSISHGNLDPVSFSLKVYAKSWSTASKQLISEYLIYNVPYYPSFEFGLGKINDDECYLEASTEFVANRTDLRAYVNALLAIERQDVDDDGNPLVDDDGNPVMISAWSDYFLPSADSGYEYDTTEDVAKGLVGFDTNKSIYQYARWYQDDDYAEYFQILSIGYDAEGHLRIATTISCLVLSALHVGAGTGWPSVYGNSDFLSMLAHDTVLFGAIYTLQEEGNDIELAELPLDSVIYPRHTEDGTTFIENEAYLYPYIYANIYSKAFHTSEVTLYLEESQAYTTSDLATVKNAYIAKGVKVTDGEDGAFYVILEQDGYRLYVGYDLYEGDGWSYLIMTFETLSFEKPFRGDFVIYDTFQLFNFADSYLVYQQTSSGAGYAYIEDAYASSLVQYVPSYDAAASSQILVNLEATKANLSKIKADIQQAARKSGYADAKLKLEWEDINGCDGYLRVGADSEPVEFFAQKVSESNGNKYYSLKLGNSTYYLVIYSTGEAMLLTSTYQLYLSFEARAEGADNWSFTYQDAEGNDVVITLALGNEYLAGSQTSYLVSDENGNASLMYVYINAVAMETTSGGTALFWSFQFVCMDHIIVNYDNWADASSKCNSLMYQAIGASLGEKPFDALPNELAHAEGATNFIADGYNGGARIIFDTVEHAQASDIGADLVAAGFVKYGPTLNGVEYYISAHGEYLLAVYYSGDNEISISFEMDNPFDPMEGIIGQYFYEMEQAAGFFIEWNFDWFDGAVSAGFLPDAENNRALAGLEYEDEETALAQKNAFVAFIEAEGFALDEDPESATYGLYVDANGRTINVSLDGTALVITFAMAPAQA